MQIVKEVLLNKNTSLSPKKKEKIFLFFPKPENKLTLHLILMRYLETKKNKFLEGL